MINRFCFAFATTLLLGCGKAEQSTSQGKELNDPSICLDMLPSSVKLEGGSVIIGSNNAYPEERPERRAEVDSFEIDTHEVTNKPPDTLATQRNLSLASMYLVGPSFLHPAQKVRLGGNLLRERIGNIPKDRIAQLRDGIWILLSR